MIIKAIVQLIDSSEGADTLFSKRTGMEFEPVTPLIMNQRYKPLHYRCTQ